MLSKSNYGHEWDYISIHVALSCFVAISLLFVKNRRITFSSQKGCNLSSAGRNLMASPRHHKFGLDLTFEIEYDAAQQAIVAGGNYAYLSYRNDSTLELFGDAFDIDMGCDDIGPEFQGMESVGSNRDADINSQIQLVTTNESQEFPFNNSWDIQQQYFDVNNETNGSRLVYGGYRDDKPLFINDLEDYDQQPFNGGGKWDILSPSDPFWSQFLLHQGQTQTSNAYDTSLGVNNEYNSGFAGHVPIPQTHLSYVNRNLTCTIRPKQRNPSPVNLGRPVDIINKQPALVSIQQYIAEPWQQPQELLQPAKDDVLIWQNRTEGQRPLAKRIKTYNGTAAPSSQNDKVAKEGRNSSRAARRINLDPTLYYQPLTIAPRSWGTIRPDGSHMFQYNNFGELKPGITLTSSEMSEYLYGKFQLPDDDGSNNPCLFIQCVPSDSNSRYPTPLSSKCRFKDCPVKTHTIPLGHFRVAFDEQSNEYLDPYHCAGFVHLYCLERFCNFAALALYCNLVPDIRRLREERNRMAIIRDHAEFSRMCRVYIEDAKHRDPHANGWEYKNTLCSLLTEEYLRLESKARRKTRERQGGNNIGVHRNDMEMYAQGEEDKRLRLREMAAQKRLKNRKRGYDGHEEEEDDSEDGDDYGE